MKKLNKLLHSIILALSIFLLYRLYSTEEFTRLDYILLAILCFSGLIIVIETRYRKRTEQK